MATNAERQAAYRKRRSEAGDNDDRRLNTWVSTGAKLNLERLAVHYCVTERELLERLITAEDAVVTSDMDETALDSYLSKKANVTQ